MPDTYWQMIRGQLALVLGVLLGCAAVVWRIESHRDPVPDAPAQQWREAHEADRKAPEVTTPIKSGRVKVKRGAEADLRMPVGPNEGVLEAARLGASERPQTVATVIDTDTGDTRQIVREEPYPWLSAKQTSEVGVFYGIRQDGRQGLILQARHDVLQVKGVHLGLVGQIDSNTPTGTAYYAGVGAWYRW